MSEEQNLEELLEEVLKLKDLEATAIVRKVYKNWQEGIIPSQSQIVKLKKLLNIDGPCARLTDEGLCNGWLRKNAENMDFKVYPPYMCPFARGTNEQSKWRDCPGYRTIGKE